MTFLPIINTTNEHDITHHLLLSANIYAIAFLSIASKRLAINTLKSILSVITYFLLVLSDSQANPIPLKRYR